jgi:hypothetical protein
MNNDVKSLPEGNATSLTVERLIHGGFVVSDGVRLIGEMTAPLFAASELSEAMDWIEAAFSGSFSSPAPKPRSDRMSVGE